mmetsp:Transcript_15289/g.20947  ORF Transcript_15289/g.20947 Transcript_15289/m.20947 type:complete len:181 (+) Transcript_15289:522-1064(+)|eukprot:CAMPEP_0170062270 /NCGR_PEP_ID=MMETSP0019_2-20121128/3551_1 /TAXON_ID=98059 /ORGANISM="Dinobryon sp., Strain UTEXLB2267" /LENGTH=180 /DNA_ID=CAMNT_0010268359 /DNA_START=352 /DNA_END=894 /DNA_ORIENTATION=+
MMQTGHTGSQVAEEKSKECIMTQVDTDANEVAPIVEVVTETIEQPPNSESNNADYVVEEADDYFPAATQVDPSYEKELDVEIEELPASPTKKRNNSATEDDREVLMTVKKSYSQANDTSIVDNPAVDIQSGVEASNGGVNEGLRTPCKDTQISASTDAGLEGSKTFTQSNEAVTENHPVA